MILSKKPGEGPGAHSGKAAEAAQVRMTKRPALVDTGPLMWSGAGQGGFGQ